jgi:outer membrane receptor for ferrienterochelin and colicin
LFENNIGRITIRGKVNDVNKTIAELEFKPTCILDHRNALNLNITFFNKRNLNITDKSPSKNSSYELDYGETRRYHINLNMKSGIKRQYRGKLIEENMNANGQPPYFKELSTTSDVKMQVSLPYFKGC